MASNPHPFQTEDSTDKDFFDNLVNDNDDLDSRVTTTSLATTGRLSSGMEEAKAFANSSIGEFDNNSKHHSVSDLGIETVKTKQVKKSEVVEDSGNTLVALSSVEFNNVMEQTENEDGGAEVLSDRTFVSKSSGEDSSDGTVVSKSSGESGAPGVKEVGWSAFHADSVGNDGNGFGSYSDFFSELGGDGAVSFENVVGGTLSNGSHVAIGNGHGFAFMENSNNFKQYNEGCNYEIIDQNSDVRDGYWENQYPGWKYDSSTGQWYQIDSYDASAQKTIDSNLPSAWGMGHEQAEISYLQPTAQSVDETVADLGRTENAINWNQASTMSGPRNTAIDWNQSSLVGGDTAIISSYRNHTSQDNIGYPPHMVFDPRYPGWYYDTITQKWHTLESYTESLQSTVQVQDHMNPMGYASMDNLYQENDLRTYNIHGQDTRYNGEGFGRKVHDQNWARPANNYTPHSSVSPWANKTVEDHHGQNFCASAHINRPDTVNRGATCPNYENASQIQNEFLMPSCSQGFVNRGNSIQQFNEFTTNRNDHKNVSNSHYINHSPRRFSQQHFESTQISYSPAAGRSSAIRPAHALVTFGFGGKLIVIKHHSSTENFNTERQNLVGGSILVLTLAEIVNDNADASSHGMGIHNYFQTLCHRCVPGPLSSGSVGSKELNKWIDERIANPDSAEVDYRKAEVLKLLLSLLKIACQYYGKLRSPYGTEAALKESDAPELAVARLFACAKGKKSHLSQYGVVAQNLHQIPSEGQMQATAAEVQSLLVSGMKKEALECAQEGHMWGPALVLAAQLGDQFYVATIKKMALCQFVAGSPLRTLCLLIASQPAEVFSSDSSALSSIDDATNTTQQRAQFGANGMLDCWEENLAVITANRTKDDELVLMHLGDCLWKDRSDVNAAHICYLVAEANFEPYSDTSRMCLVGADHWKFPRTYACPEAIQRTEVYEYSKTLGNSQFVLLPFQPYKLIYAQMLAEVGRMSDALKYCQAVLKSLKTGRTPDTLRHQVLSLEERIKAHQHGGFSTNLAPKRFVGKLLNLFDNTAHRVVGGMPSPISTSSGVAQGNENHQSLGPKVSTSQSTMAMSSLVPSQSKGPTSEWTTDKTRKSKHTRSISEPDVGRSPRQGHADYSKDESSTGLEEKTSTTSGTSRLGRFSFGSQLFQKTVGLVLKPRQDRQAKLGETNKFYYDEKLKRWVEEGSKLPAEEAALPPPPPTAVSRNRTTDYKLKSAFQHQTSYSNGNPEYKSPSVVDNNSGIPPIPPTTNQYSVRGRTGVRSRYVDTFNKGGEVTTNLFRSPYVPPIKPANQNFFVPTPVSAAEQPADVYDVNSTYRTYENLSTSPLTDTFQSHEPPSLTTMKKIPSLNNISNQGTIDNGSFPVQSRRTTSWGGSLNDCINVPHIPDVKPLGEVLGMHPSSFMPGDPASIIRLSKDRDDLHEVEL